MAAKWTAVLLVLWLAATAVVAQDSGEQPKTTTEEVEESASNAMNNVKESADSFANWVSSEFSGPTPPQGDQNLADKTKESVSMNSAAHAAEKTSRRLLDSMNYASEKGHEAKLAVVRRIGRSLRAAQSMPSEEEMKNKAVDAFKAASGEGGHGVDKASELVASNMDKSVVDIMNAEPSKEDKTLALEKANEALAKAKGTNTRRRVLELDDISEEDVERKINNNEAMLSEMLTNAKDTTTSNFERESMMEKINEAMDRAARMIRRGKRVTKDRASPSSPSSSSSNDVIRMTTDKASDAKTMMADAVDGWKHRAFNNYKNAKGMVKESLYEVAKERVV